MRITAFLLAFLSTAVLSRADYDDSEVVDVEESDELELLQIARKSLPVDAVTALKTDGVGSEADEEDEEEHEPEAGVDADSSEADDVTEADGGGDAVEPRDDGPRFRHPACLRASSGANGGACQTARKQAESEIKKASAAAKKLDDARKLRGVDTAKEGQAPRGIMPRGPDASVGEPPVNIRRAGTHYGYCDCGTGFSSATFWPNDDTDKSVTVNQSSIRWIKFDQAVTKITFECNGMKRVLETTYSIKQGDWISMQVFPQEADDSCKEHTSFLKFNRWKDTDYVSSVPFTTTTDGYNCFKIPAMMVTQAGTFIAFSEARKPDCSDFAETDLVYKRSTDGGLTWGPLKLLVHVSDDERHDKGVCGFPLVIGNMAPVQVRADFSANPGRILAPYTRNNFEHWIVHSDDDGETFTGDAPIPGAQIIDSKPDCHRNMSYFGFKVDKLDIWNANSFVDFAAQLCFEDDPYRQFANLLTGPWQFIGAGPPGSLQTTSGRILVPSYHSYIRGIEGDGVLPTSQLYNNFALGHVLISDDGGDTWRMSDNWEIGHGANENQMVQLKDGTILTNMRSLSTGSPQYRLQARSTDDGESFGPSEFVKEIPEPFNGCQGSTTHGADPDTVYVANPDPPPANTILQNVANTVCPALSLTGRRAVTVWKSTDGGRTYPTKVLLDRGLSAQTSLQWFNGKLWMMYEQADREPSSMTNYMADLAIGDVKILLPSRMIFREVPV